MTRRRPSHIPRRLPVYIGCEGASEVGYAALLQDILRTKNLPIHLIVEELGPGAGDPLTRIDVAVRRLAHLEKKRTKLAKRFALLDSDQAERDPQRAAEAKRVAATNNIVIVWQRPCFEAVLLRHLPGRATHRPPDTPLSEQALVREWPEYKKPMTRAELSKRLDVAAVLRAAAVEPELAELLRCLKLL